MAVERKHTADSLTICFVSQEYPEETGWGGIGTYTFEMAHGLARAGHKAIVVTRALTQPQHYFEDDGVEVYRILPALPLDSVPVLWRFNQWWEGYRLGVAIKLRQILCEQPIDIIESPELHAEPLLYSLANSKPPLVVRLHSGSGVLMRFETNHSSHNWLNRKMEGWLTGKASHVTSPSMALRHSQNGNGSSSRLTVIPNPVDVDHFKPNSAWQQAALAPDVLCVGRPRFLKGIHVMAQAIPKVWQEIPEATFTFVPARMGKDGGAPEQAYREFLGSLVEDSRVRILDSVSRDQLPEIYGRATVCVIPSLWEGFGYVAAEAMACGAVVIASRAGGLAEIVEDGKSGILVEPGDAGELAAAIVELIRDGKRRHTITIAARKRIVDNFARPLVAAQMANLYGRLVQGSSAVHSI